jgi:hypothetical protein
VSKCPIHRVAIRLIPVSRVFRYERRASVSPLTESLSCPLQTPILNKSKQILIFGQYHPSKVIILCTYCLPSDHKCGGENLSLTSSLCGLPFTSGPEHDSAQNPGSVPSYCILPLFHAPAREGQVTFGSINGMAHMEPYNCYSPRCRSCLGQWSCIPLQESWSDAAGF